MSMGIMEDGEDEHEREERREAAGLEEPHQSNNYQGTLTFAGTMLWWSSARSGEVSVPVRIGWWLV